MERKEKEDQLYLDYQRKLRNLEENLEVFSKKKKRFEEKKERRYSKISLNQERLLEFSVQWGSEEETNRAQAILEEYIMEEQTALRKEEDTLQEEYQHMRREERICETDYQQQVQQLQEESV